MPSFQMPNYNQQFENLQQQIGGMGYGGPSLEDIQGIMPSYQGYGGPSLEDIQGIMPSYGGPSLTDIQGTCLAIKCLIIPRNLKAYNNR